MREALIAGYVADWQALLADLSSGELDSRVASARITELGKRFARMNYQEQGEACARCSAAVARPLGLFALLTSEQIAAVRRGYDGEEGVMVGDAGIEPATFPV